MVIIKSPVSWKENVQTVQILKIFRTSGLDVMSGRALRGSVVRQCSGTPEGNQMVLTL